MPPPSSGNEHDLNKRVKHYSNESLQCNILDQALAHIQHTNEQLSQTSSLTKIVSALARVGQEESALSIIDTIPSMGQRAEVLAHLIPLLTKARKDQAIGLLLNLDHKTENVNQYAFALADALFSFSEPLKSRIYARLLVIAEGQVYPFDLLLKIAPYINENFLSQILSIAQRSRVTAPLPRTLAAIALHIKEPLRTQLIEMAVTMLPLKMEVIKKEIDAFIVSHPKVLAIKEVLSALAQVGQWDRAFSTAQSFTNTALRAQLLTVLALSIEEPQRHSLLQQALLLAQNYDDAYARARTLIAIAPSWSERMQPPIFEQALLTAQTMESPYDQQAILCTLMPSLSPEAGERALKMALMIPNAIAGIWALAGIAPYLSSTQQIPILSKALETAESIPHPYYRDDARQRIGVSLAQIGYLERAVDLIQTIEDQAVKTRAFAHIVSLWAEEQS